MRQSEVSRYAEENKEMLVRVLVCGDPEAAGYALALLKHAEPDPEFIEEVIEQLEQIKLEARR